MKKYFKAGLSLIVIAACIYITSCKPKQAATKATQAACASSPTYTADIKQILDVNCGNTCHSEAKKKHGIDLSSYEPSKEAASRNSFMGSIRHEDGFDAMPANHAKLDDATIEKLACWVKNGMPK